MISNRSILSNAGLALAAVLGLVSSSCLHTQSAHHERSLAVKAEADSDFEHAQTESLRSHSQFAEPEYVEGDVAPAVPAALPEVRGKAPSSSHVWIAGAHTRHDGQWEWVAGHYAVPPSPDKVWVPGHWVAHLHGFAWIPGAWR